MSALKTASEFRPAPGESDWEAEFPELAAFCRDHDVKWFFGNKRHNEGRAVNAEFLPFLIYSSIWRTEARRRWVFDAACRVVSWSACLVAVILLLPLFLAVAVAIKVTSPGPLLFVQTRTGRFGRPFQMLKFRTMFRQAEFMASPIEHAEGKILKPTVDPRVTRVGAWLRRSSLDELPQFFNILAGHMTLIGPRPMPPDETAFIPNQGLLRFAVRPGITGLAQVTARDLRGASEKSLIDVEYIRNRSFRMNLSILARTVQVVLHGS